MGMICFIILHYNVIEETKRCIDSIRQLDDLENTRIVIVDNASPNGTGQELLKKYKNDEAVAVLCREKNDGFSAGNNVGCSYAIQRWKPDFLIVANNDIIFPQHDFVTLIRKEYFSQKFAVLGPDIYNPLKHVHQSPLGKALPSEKQVKKTIFLNQIMLLLYRISYPIMKNYYAKQEIACNVKDYDKRQENVCLMGACLVLSKDYYQKREQVFMPETQFYYEENIMMLWCKKHQERVLYQPAMQVWHMDGKATETINDKQRERIRFRMKNVLSAAKIYWKYFREIENGE